MTRQPDGAPSPREAGLRRLAAESGDRIDTVLRQALSEHRAWGPPKKSADLDALVDGVAASMPRGTNTSQRATALWRLIKEEVGRLELSDERTALTAALHLDSTNREPSIDKRLAFARDRGDFGTKPSGKHHGYDALRQWWGEGVRLLSHTVDQRLRHLRKHPGEWREHFQLGEPRFRAPSKGAQPVFVELFVTTVFMKGRHVHRRITERLVTAQEDGVEFYTARALPELSDATASVPVRAVWGCSAEQLPASPGEPILTRLWFPTALRRGQRHYFSSEALAGEVHHERRAINVEVDHHGIAPGRRTHDVMPVSGLTVRMSFDVGDLPDAVWWYADVTERERYERPDPDDDRLLELTRHGFAEHTFTEPCQPLANYGVAFSWPTRPA